MLNIHHLNNSPSRNHFVTPRRWQGNDLDSFEVKSRGFTIIELLLVILIISIIGLMSASFYSRFLTQNAVDNTVNQLVSSFRKAQTYSMMGKQSNNCTVPPCNWGVNYSSNTITLYLGNSFVNRTQAFDEKFNVNTNVSITSSTGILDWNFTRVTGLASNTPATITISGGNNSKIINMNSQGVVSRTN